VRIVVDTSALVAILLGEPERDAFVGALADHEPAISAGTLIETLRIMQVRRGAAALSRVERLLATHRVEVVPVDAAQVALAQDGMVRFGRGRGAEPAVLNVGDLFAYALARHLDAPLLFQGDGLARTDVTPVVSPAGGRRAVARRAREAPAGGLGVTEA
jgi:ribonuclease VapC